MGQPTQRFKKSVSGSIGAGMKSVIGGDGRRFFVLEHKVSSKYHKAGEEQKIIVDQIEIGRDPQCAVRLEGTDPNDKMFLIVSRKHAAIEKDGDNWTLVHLSTTNSTFLNGRKLDKPGQKWYLQNGDEIQIAESGPKLGFKIPQGEKGLVKSLRMTDRLNLFRQQALRPYKHGIVALTCLLLLASSIGGYVIYHQDDRISTQGKQIIAQGETIKEQDNVIKMLGDSITALSEEYISLIKINKDLEKQLDKIREQVDKLPPSVDLAPSPDKMTSLNKDVYWITAEKVVVVQPDGSERVVEGIHWIATGFLLDNYKFVTARHCVEGWRYPQGSNEEVLKSAILCAIEDRGEGRIKSYLKAYSNDGTIFSFTSDDFHSDKGRTDVVETIKLQNEDGSISKLQFKRGNHDGTDYAWVKTNKRGSLHANASLSENLKQGEKVYVLGYPLGLGAGADVSEQKKMIPSYSESTVARPGLTENGRIHLSNRNFEGGNSGGPVFVFKDGKYQVVAIVSHGQGSIGFVTPIFKIGN